MKQVAVVLLLTLAFGFTACGDNASASKSTVIRNWEAEIGFALPAPTRLVAEDNGGGRDASFGFHEWVFESSCPIDMPKLNAPGVKDYLNLPLDRSTALIESRLEGSKITNPTIALGSEWTSHGANFRGTVVRTTQGDYLMVERFRK